MSIVDRRHESRTRWRFVEIESRHAAPLAALFERNNRASTLRRFDPFPLTAETAQAITRTPRADLYFGAEVAGRLVGLTMLRGWDEGYEIPSFGILIDRAHRGLGLGRVMTELTIQRARAAGCRQVRLSVYESNPVAMRLYAQLGFVETERTPARVAGGEDVRVVMLLELVPGSGRLLKPLAIPPTT